MITVSFLVYANEQHGYGHLVRCLALAWELRKRGCVCSFFTNAEARRRLAGYFSLEAPESLDELPPATVWISDLEHGTPPSVARILRDKCKLFVLLNGTGYGDKDEGRLLSDFCFYQGASKHPAELDWPGYCGEWFEGVKWIILRHGGLGAHRKATHFFLGLILGEFTVGSLWTIIGIIFGMPTYRFWV